MRNRETYEYAVIRLVPRVEREEFLNLGVILFSKRNHFLGVKYRIDKDRISAFAPEIDIEMIEKYLRSWDWICSGGPKGGKIGEMELASRFRWLVASRSTMIQSSPTHPGICHEPQKVLDTLFEMYVL